MEVETHCVEVPVVKRSIPLVPVAFDPSKSEPRIVRFVVVAFVIRAPVVKRFVEDAVVAKKEPVVVALVKDAATALKKVAKRLVLVLFVVEPLVEVKLVVVAFCAKRLVAEAFVAAKLFVAVAFVTVRLVIVPLRAVRDEIEVVESTD